MKFRTPLFLVIRTRPVLDSGLVFLFLICLTLSGCGGGGGGGGGGTSEDDPESLRFVNAVTEGDAVEITVGADNAQQLEVEYGDGTDYIDSPEGDVSIRVRETDHVVPAITETQSIESGKAYTYLLTKADSAVTGTLIEDTNDLEDQSAVKLRVVNAAISSETIDLYVAFDDQSIKKLDPTIAAAKFISPSDYVLFDEGSYRISATRTGSEKVLTSEADVELQGGRSYTVYVLEDKEGGSPFSLVVLANRS